MLEMEWNLDKWQWFFETVIEWTTTYKNKFRRSKHKNMNL